MVLTIGIMVGFIFGFILFLSRLPNDTYTLVETERGIEQIDAADADQYNFYDRLSDSNSLVPNAAAEDLPSFTRSSSEGKYGADANQRPRAVEIADELTVGTEVAPVEIAAVGAGNLGATGAVASVTTANNSAAGSGVRDTVVKRSDSHPSTFYYLQAGAFNDPADANRLQRQLVRSGMDAFINNVAIEGKRWHRVRVGPFYDADSLTAAQTRLGRNGISYLVVKVQRG